MGLFHKTEYEKWATADAMPRVHRLGLPGLDPGSRRLYGEVLPRGAGVPRFTPDRPPVNQWMPPHEVLRYRYLKGQILLGTMAGSYIGLFDDRPMVTIAGSRSGKSSTILEPNLYTYPGSMLVLDPKCELTPKTARVRQALGHDVIVLDPFGQSGEVSASFNALAELDPNDPAIIDDAASIAQALIVSEGDGRSQHWNDAARTLILGLILLVLLMSAAERNLVTVRQLVCLSHPMLRDAVRRSRESANDNATGPEYFDANKHAVETLLGAMAQRPNAFGGILSSIGNRFLSTPLTERGSIFSTAATQTDFLDSLPMRSVSRRSDFRLADLRGDRPLTIYLTLPVGRMQSHYRWLRMIVQLACTALEKLGPYPRTRTPILFLAEEFAVLGHMDIAQKAAAYLPGLGVKLWAVLQDITQLQSNYRLGWETFLGNAGVVQAFSNGDQSTLELLSRRLEGLMKPFELRAAFSRERGSQLLLIEGKPPAAVMRLAHDDVAALRAGAIAEARARLARLPQLR